MKVWCLLFFIFAMRSAGAQSPAGEWQHVSKQDVLNAKTIDRYVLFGKYLSPPKVTAGENQPTLVVECHAQKVLQNFVNVGAVVNSRFMEARLDGKRFTLDGDSISTDGLAVFFSRLDLGKVLVGHTLILGADEYLGAQVIMQFDLPDSSIVFAGCGRDIFLKQVKR